MIWRSPKLRYLMVGGLCAGVHNLIMIAGAWAHLHYVASTAVSYVVVMLLGYWLHTHVTFSVQANRRAFWRYAGATAMNYPLWLVLMFVFCDLIGLPMIVASPLGTVLFLIWNYLISRWAILHSGQPQGVK